MWIKLLNQGTKNVIRLTRVTFARCLNKTINKRTCKNVEALPFQLLIPRVYPTTRLDKINLDQVFSLEFTEIRVIKRFDKEVFSAKISRYLRGNVSL